MPNRRQASRPALHEFGHAIRLVHTSDIHIGVDADHVPSGVNHAEALIFLRALIDHAQSITADLIVIVGDFFDHNRLADRIVDDTVAVLADTALPVVILPGNHDPFTDQSIYARFATRFPSNVRVLRSKDGELLALPQIGVQLWGQAHTAYEDFSPAAAAPTWISDSDAPYWRVAMAHGSTVDADGRAVFGYRIQSREIEALDAHYVALGHLERPRRVAPMTTHAYYSGSPKIARGFTVVDLTPGGVSVRPVTLFEGGSPLNGVAIPPGDPTL